MINFSFSKQLVSAEHSKIFHYQLHSSKFDNYISIYQLGRSFENGSEHPTYSSSAIPTFVNDKLNLGRKRHLRRVQ